MTKYCLELNGGVFINNILFSLFRDHFFFLFLAFSNGTLPFN